LANAISLPRCPLRFCFHPRRGWLRLNLFNKRYRGGSAMRENASLDWMAIGSAVALAFSCQIANAWSGYDEFKPKTAEEAERRQRIEQESASPRGVPVTDYSSRPREEDCSRNPGGCSSAPQFLPQPPAPLYPHQYDPDRPTPAGGGASVR